MTKQKQFSTVVNLLMSDEQIDKLNRLRLTLEPGTILTRSQAIRRIVDMATEPKK